MGGFWLRVGFVGDGTGRTAVRPYGVLVGVGGLLTGGCWVGRMIWVGVGGFCLDGRGLRDDYGFGDAVAVF